MTKVTNRNAALCEVNSQRQFHVIVIACLLFGLTSIQAANPKRGFGGSDGEKITGTNSSWYYRWGNNRTSDSGVSAEFVPMFWGGGSVTTNNINAIANDASIDYVLGFNEPERTDQANMTVTNALNKWSQLQSLSSSGKTLVSPAVSDNAAGKAWLQDFMTQADSQGLTVDEVAFHWYGTVNPTNPTQSANQFLNRVDWYHNTFNRPVWITEFGGIDWGGNYDTATMNQANKEFLQRALTGLDNRSYVTRYAWWNWNSDTSLLAGSNPTTPTTIGEEWIDTVVNSGEAFDILGVSHGDDVFYLRDAELTNTGGSSINAIRYLDAIEGTNTLSGTSRWDVRNDGWLRVRSGATLRKQGTNSVHWNNTQVINNGTIVVQAGRLALERTIELTGSGQYVVDPGGTLSFWNQASDPGIELAQSVMINGGTLDAMNNQHAITGSVTLQSDSVVKGNGDLHISGSTSGAGRLTKQGPGTLRISGASTRTGQTNVSEGTLHLQGGSSSVGNGNIVIETNGQFIGSGLIIGDVDVAGQWSPGNSDQSNGAFTLFSDLTLRDSAELKFDVSALNTKDHVVVSGQAILDGTLTVTDLDVASEAGLAIELIVAGDGVSGRFDDLVLPASNSVLTWQLMYDTDQVFLASTPALPGDFNADGTVDAADFTVWRDAVGSTGPGLLADANGDLVVNAIDYLFWKNNFGAVWNPTVANIVPEPNHRALGLATLLIIGSAQRRRRRNRARTGQGVWTSMHPETPSTASIRQSRPPRRTALSFLPYRSKS